MRNRGYVTNERNFETCCVYCTQCRFTTSTGTLNINTNSTHTVVLCFFGCGFSSYLSSKRSGFA